MPRKSSSSSSTVRHRSTTRRGTRTTRRRINNKNNTMRTKYSTSGAASTQGRSSNSNSSALSARTRKAIDTLPSHAQKIYRKAHKNALHQYENPSKRRGGKRQNKEQIAHKVAWSAVKKEYKKKGDKWVPRKD